MFKRLCYQTAVATVAAAGPRTDSAWPNAPAHNQKIQPFLVAAIQLSIFVSRTAIGRAPVISTCA